MSGVDPAPPLRILVAEDIEVNREILRHALGRRGHSVAFACNGAEALACVQREGFDLVLMDVRMPVMDGVEATRRIRSLPGAAGRTPIIALTANAMPHERRHYLAGGMDGCIAKPIDWVEFWEVLARYGGSTRDCAASAETPQADAVLVDTAVLHRLQEFAPEGEVPQWIAAAIRAAGEAADAMPGADAKQRLAHAHKLKGMAGTFGLARVSGLAARIEDAVQRGNGTDALVVQLAAAVAQSRSELVRLELLPADG